MRRFLFSRSLICKSANKNPHRERKSNMNITLKDGSVKVYDAPVSAADVCKDLSWGLYRAACC